MLSFGIFFEEMTASIDKKIEDLLKPKLDSLPVEPTKQQTIQEPEKKHSIADKIGWSTSPLERIKNNLNRGK